MQTLDVRCIMAYLRVVTVIERFVKYAVDYMRMLSDERC